MASGCQGGGNERQFIPRKAHLPKNSVGQLVEHLARSLRDRWPSAGQDLMHRS
jgi:hypothetical protein